jgi:hypothetical protein
MAGHASFTDYVIRQMNLKHSRANINNRQQPYVTYKGLEKETHTPT